MKLGYIRCSCEKQNIARQEALMQELGADEVFIDKMSGKSADRPQLKKMLSFARKGDTVIVSEISRFARNTKDLLELVELLSQKEVAFISQKEAIDTTTPAGRFVLTIFGAIAELEREYILQRQAEGIKEARKMGKYRGRKKKETPDFDKVYEQVQSGVITATRGWELLAISKSSWYRRVREKQRSAGNQASK